MAKKQFSFRGKTLEELQTMDIKEFAELLPAKLRRSVVRGFTHDEQAVLVKMQKNKAKVRTHSREMIVLPQMVGKVISVHNGKAFVDIHVNAEMLGHRLGEFADTRQRVGHNSPGIGATRSSSSASVK